jgi:hypothetical protein
MAMIDYHFSMSKFSFVVVFASALAGCAGGLSNPDVSDTTTKLAMIEVTRNTQKSQSDCPVTVRISNRTKIDWDGASYHLVMHNRNGVTIGKLLGSPRKSVKAGGNLVDTNQVLGAKCEQIAGTALVYFGYYPAGKKQISVHNVNVQIRVK